LLLAKYNEEDMEWSMLEPVDHHARKVLRFAGAATWKHGFPEGAAAIMPGCSFTFGETLLQVVDGDWKKAYYEFRKYMENKGCRPRDGYNPPVLWNELYDNKYYWIWSKLFSKPYFSEIKDVLASNLYSLDDMKWEAAKAQELGCETLYLDPGWDTGMSHQVWDSARLGSLESFVKTIKDEYGLNVAVWAGLGQVPPTTTAPDALPLDAWAIGADGNRLDNHCYASPAFIETKNKRLAELCKNGVSFIMIDSTQAGRPCYDASHGHRIPSTKGEHARAIFGIIQTLKRQYPHVLVEAHDRITGPTWEHYMPFYFQYTQPDSFDCIWGNELMLFNMDWIINGNAKSLYYYNLASKIPVYLHVDLRTDNVHCLVFWWFASTCRHLGVGGRHLNNAVWEAQKSAMKTYRKFKRFYTTGEFYGLDETIHVHTLPDEAECVLNIFNIKAETEHRRVIFDLTDVGLSAGPIAASGITVSREGDKAVLDFEIPAFGHKFCHLKRTQLASCSKG
jgi:hypothetical protein